ncbi:MAG: hypothetical protein OXG46_07810 [Chloroflexi bacterium]|nr:hypothetical protein [Chloroflexota bacterium]MCY3938811.1 hypothetical protein [Chloroflexota bacterium]
MTELGELVDVDIRCIWPKEANDFTPWHADNLEVLSKALNVDLEFQDKEVGVGAYRADIVAEVTGEGTRVLIENQLEHANLQHLGQAQVYLAGLDAKIVVWVAAGFNEEILSAIRWLNEHTVDPFAFFAVRVRAVRIGDSLPAPIFDVLERPNEWDRQVTKRTVSGLSEIGKFRRDFWEHYARRQPDPGIMWPDLALPTNSHDIEELDLKITQFLAQYGVGVYVTGKELSDRFEEYFPRVEPYVSALEAALGGKKLRQNVNNHACSTSLRIDSRDRANWDEMSDWLDKTRQIYERVLQSSPSSGA